MKGIALIGQFTKKNTFFSKAYIEEQFFAELLIAFVMMSAAWNCLLIF